MNEHTKSELLSRLRKSGHVMPASIVRDQSGNVGVAFLLSAAEGRWASGSVVVMWPGGDITTADDCDAVGPENLWEAMFQLAQGQHPPPLPKLILSPATRRIDTGNDS
jgi:hypothetical protein